jgi:hypothetical protein
MVLFVLLLFVMVQFVVLFVMVLVCSSFWHDSTMTKGRTNSTMTKRSRTKSIPLQKEKEQTIP